MMSNLHVLIIEDDDIWQETLRPIGEGLAEHVEISTAADYNEALGQASNRSFDLAIVDLGITGDPSDPRDDVERGMDLLRSLRESRYNSSWLSSQDKVTSTYLDRHLQSTM